MSNLNPEKAFIFRIVHVANVAWILEHGMHCRASATQDPDYINIGSPSLIDRRSRRVVPVPPGGTLSNYVPFYFTPFSIMMYNIHTGHGGITKRANKDIVIFVSSIHRLRELGLPYLFTNQHAYPPDTDFYSDVADLKEIDWRLLQSRNFKTDDADPGKQLRYQAESLVHHRVQLEALLGLVCYNDEVRRDLETMIQERDKNLSVKTIPNWYF
jgi:hypothetical protein